MKLTIEVDKKEDQTIVYLSGEIDVYTATDLKDTLLPLTKDTGKLIKIDLGNVIYLDSTGLGVFISVLKSARANDACLKLINLKERVLRLFKITGLDEIMDVQAVIRGGSE